MAEQTVKIKFSGESRDAERAAKAVEKALKNVGQQGVATSKSLQKSFSIDSKGAVREVKQLDKAMDNTGKHSQRLGSALKTGLKAAAVGIGAAFLGIGAALRVGVKEFAQAQKETAQTNAVLKSTGGIANVTKKHVLGLAGSLQKLSGVDDELIQHGENVLLTFTKIRNEAGKGNKIFDQATKAALNLSVALGKDMQSSATLVGKALNDPIKGLTALQKVGVAFTKQQKDQIKALLETGRTAEDVAKIQKAAAKAVEAAQKQVAASTKKVASAQDALASSADHVRAAQEKLRDSHRAEAAAAERVRDATDKVRDAKDKLTEAQKRGREAQLALTEARKDAKRVLDDLRDSAEGAALSEEGAEIRLARAREHLVEVNKDSTASELDRREAILSVKEAEQGLEESHENRQKAIEDLNEAEKKGVENSDAVIKAKQGIRDADKESAEAAKGVKEAQEDLGKAYDGVRDSQRKVAEALGGVKDALKDQRDAQHDLRDAINDQREATEKLSGKQDDLRKAQKLQADATVDQKNLLKAQKIILGELNTEFGNVAKMVGDTLPGKLNKLKERFNNFTGDVVAKTIPVLERFAHFIRDKVVPAIQHFADQLSKAPDFQAKIHVVLDVGAQAVKDVARKIGDLVVKDGDWREVGQKIGEAIGAAIELKREVVANLLTQLVEGIRANRDAIAAAGAEILIALFLTLTDPEFWLHHWKEALAVAIAVFGGKVVAFGGRIGILLGESLTAPFRKAGGTAALALVQGLHALPESVRKVLFPILGVIADFARHMFSPITRQVEKVPGEVAAEIRKIPTVLKRALSASALVAVGRFIGNGIIEGLKATFGGINRLGQFFRNQTHALGKALRDGIVSGLEGLAHALFIKLRHDILESIKSIRRFFHIGSPSKATAKAIGEPLGQGIVDGFASALKPLDGVLKDAVGGLGVSAFGGRSGVNPSTSALSTRRVEISVRLDVKNAPPGSERTLARELRDPILAEIRKYGLRNVDAGLP